MNWIESISETIKYIEEHLTENLNIEDIANRVYISPYYFQKSFKVLCGYTVAEYIRYRRLAMAGNEVLMSDTKIIDIAMKYGYDSPDSFTKAFTRFHGATPIAVRNNNQTIKTFAPLKLKLSLDGGYIMNYRMAEKEAFRVIGISRTFKSETSYSDLPQFWTEYSQSMESHYIHGIYGICIESEGNADEFEYMIADDYYEGKDISDKFKVLEIPKHLWIIFPCVGAMPQAIQEVNKKIFSEWLPNCSEYEIEGKYDIQYYADVTNYEKGNQDEKYYSEIWIPVKNRER